MRCQICNVRLENHELSKKDLRGNFLDTCGDCLNKVHEIVNSNQEDYIKDVEKPLDTD